jgi:hypothetical protein
MATIHIVPYFSSFGKSMKPPVRLPQVVFVLAPVTSRQPALFQRQPNSGENQVYVRNLKKRHLDQGMNTIVNVRNLKK